MAEPYHLTVIGSRFPQLALGTLLAKQGKRVLIVDSLTPGSGQQNKAAKGFRYRKRPVPMSGLDSGGFLRKLLGEIGIGHVLVNEAYPRNDVSYQIVLPRNRLNIYPEREHLLAEVSREFPSSLEKIRELYEEWDAIASRWFSGSDSVKDLEKAWSPLALMRHKLRGLHGFSKGEDGIGAFGQSTPEFNYFSIQHQFIGALPAAVAVSPLSGALIHSIGRRGTYQETAGSDGLTALMLKRFQEYGGEFLDSVKVTSIDTATRDNLGIELSDGQKIRTGTLSTTAEIAATIEGLLPKLPARPPKGSVPLCPIRFYLGIEDRVVPKGMEDNVYFMREDDGGPLRLKSCYLALSPAGSDLAPEGNRSVTVTSLLPTEALKNVNPEITGAVREDLLQALEAVIPFLNEGLKEFSSDLEPKGGDQVPRALPTGKTAWYPGITGRMAITSRFRGKVALINPTPWELGTEGEALAATAAAGIVKKALG